ncbi:MULTISPECIES: hypothetical protein [Clostridium]|jgi:hypothetical protein|uniref:Uncharacterized protein n=1 Tax=Clostridium intestinale TaxID=36845 RepID=A0A7D6VV01_9CLOT|nr:MULTISPECIES: hypothetical protein [Clostridium]QLY79752.1 hypothetical protein HZF06_22485 [Clostridium intestinale]
MKELEKFDEKKYVKLKVKSMTINGKESGKIIKAEDIKNQQSIVVDIVVSKEEENKE